MNKLQVQIFDVISSLLSEQNFEESVKNSAIRYGFLNYIAKYSLANDEYWATPSTHEYLKNNFVGDKGLLRGRKSRKNRFTFEHPVPVNVVADAILEHHGNTERVREILESSDLVTILTTDEASKLSGPLRSGMPSDWMGLEADPYARYHKTGLIAGMDLKKEFEIVKMYGALAR